MVADLKSINKKISLVKAALVEEYSLRSIAVFGSYASGTQSDGSDLDILVEFEKTPGLFKFFTLQDYLSDLLNLKVDLVSINSLKSPVKEYILNQAEYL